VDFRILGPLEVTERGQVLEIPSGQRRALLIDLLLHANEVVPDDRLIDNLWGERPPPTAHKILQLHVSNLRKALGPARISRVPPGYVLHVEDQELDVDRVRRIADGDASPDSLREALSEWRGRALIDVEFEGFARADAERLEELRLSLLERLYSAELERGRHAEVVAELEGLVAARPLRERSRALLMLALYRSGRQAEALDRYRAGRALLVNQLGLEPSPELQRLQQQILEHDAELASPTPRPLRRRHAAIVGLAAGVLAAAVGLAFLLQNGASAVKPSADSLLAVAATDGRFLRALPVGATPRAVAATPRALFVANFGDSTFTRVDLVRQTSSTLGLAVAPTAVAAGAGAAWVGSAFGRTLVRVGAATGSFDGSVVLAHPVDALAAGRGGVWAVNEEAGTLTHIDPTTLRARVLHRRFAGPSGVAVAGGNVWVAESFARRLVRLNPATGDFTTIKLTLTPDALSEGCGSIWLTNPAENEVTQIDESSLRERLIAVGESPIAVSASGSTAWVADDLSHTLEQIDCRRGAVTRTIVLGGNERGKAKLSPTAVAALDRFVWVAVQSF
jgi:DNA-binding SARP family transcriptional activator/DNA-binding beta-propeller fold protein YncE